MSWVPKLTITINSVLYTFKEMVAQRCCPSALRRLRDDIYLQTAERTSDTFFEYGPVLWLFFFLSKLEFEMKNKWTDKLYCLAEFKTVETMQERKIVKRNLLSQKEISSQI